MKGNLFCISSSSLIFFRPKALNNFRNFDGSDITHAFEQERHLTENVREICSEFAKKKPGRKLAPPTVCRMATRRPPLECGGGRVEPAGFSGAAETRRPAVPAPRQARPPGP